MSLNLDLENFEAECSRDSPYILTSPRSLKACSILGVKPNELVYRGLEEYEEVLCDRPLSEVYRTYEDNETRRQELLLKCREQREILKHQSKMAVTQGSDENSSTPSEEGPNQGKGRPGARTTSRSASDKKSKTRSDQSSGKVIKRFTSAPNVNKRSSSQVTFERSDDNIKSSVSSLSPRTRSRSSSGRRLQRLQTSDTESTEDRIHTSLIDNPFYSSDARSVPDLRVLSSKSNLDFRKVQNSLRNQCPCHWDVEDRSVLCGYFKEYEDLLQNPDLTPEDRKIMECLIMKKGKQVEWERRSQEMRKLIEQDRTRRWTENQLMMQSWQEKLAEKRHFENLENAKRYNNIQSQWNASRGNLMRYLEERDRKVQRYLEDLNYKKKKAILEKQRQESLRQLEVGKAIEKLVEEDRAHRQVMREKLQRRMEEADTRKRRRERDYLRHVAEMNRMEDIKRSLKLERLEQKTRESVEGLKTQIEEKEHRARINYLNRVQLRDRALSEGSGSRKVALEKVRNIHADLVKGLEEWHKKVLELHVEAQRRAEIKYNQEIHRRRIRCTSDRILREERSSEMLRKVHELEEQRKGLLKTVIQTKEVKSARVKADKDRKVQISRIRAQHAAELREQLKNKLSPDTFDRKAARAEMELRIMKKTPPPGFGVRFHPKLITKRCSSCTSSGNGNGNGSGISNGSRRNRHLTIHGSGGSAFVTNKSRFGGPLKC